MIFKFSKWKLLTCWGQQKWTSEKLRKGSFAPLEEELKIYLGDRNRNWVNTLDHDIPNFGQIHVPLKS